MHHPEPNLFTAWIEGNLRFVHDADLPLLLLLIVLIVLLVWWLWRQPTRPLSTGWKVFFISLRSSVLVLLLLCLLRPVTTSLQVTPQKTWLGIIFDDSRSMGIKDPTAAGSRQEAVQNALANAGVLEQLADSFQLRSFRFHRQTEAITDTTGLTASGTASDIHQALQFVDTRLNGLPLAGLVLISDGVDNGRMDPLQKARDFGNRQIPVFTVGTGQEVMPRDIGIVDVSTSRTLLAGSVFDVTVSLQQRGYTGQQVQLSVLDGELVVQRQLITLGSEDIPQRYQLQLTPSREEAVIYQVQVELQPDELIEQNNRSSFLVDNSIKQPLDILYIEGHPRNEYKFIRRAIEPDNSLRLVTYLQTGPEKYYRQGIASPAELSDGFPADRATLFQYEALLLGDIAPDFFTAGQLQMIQDFVAERGGGLLMSGMIDEEFITTPIADILPVTPVREDVLPAHLRGGIRRGNHATGELFAPRRTAAGKLSPWLRLSGDEQQNQQLWQRLPPLQGVHVSGRSKPGASVLLEHPRLQYRNQALPILAWQRYGSGRSMVLTTASTWRWQMMMPREDQSHEILWRQLLRWLAVTAPERIGIGFDREFYHVGDEVQVTAMVLDADYQADNHATVYLQITDPLDQVTDQPMAWDMAQDGAYRASFVARQEGIYRLLVDVASAAGEAAGAGSANAVLAVTPSLREYRHTTMNSGLLTRIAEVSGGSFLPLDQVGQLADAIRFTPNAWSREVQIELWNQPWLLALLISLLSIDWLVRRMQGLS